MRHKLHAVPESTPEQLIESFVSRELDEAWRLGSLLAQRTMERETEKYKMFSDRTGYDSLIKLAHNSGLSGITELLKLMVTPFLPGKGGKPWREGALAQLLRRANES